jgi:hypothetical protein
VKYFLLGATLAIAMLILIGILGAICFDVSAIAEPGRGVLYRFGGTTFPDWKSQPGKKVAGLC